MLITGNSQLAQLAVPYCFQLTDMNEHQLSPLTLIEKYISLIFKDVCMFHCTSVPSIKR